MKRYLIAAVVYSITAAGFYFWMDGSVGAARLTQFWLWAWVLLSALAAFVVIKDAGRMPPRVWPLVWAGRVYGAIVVVLLVWNGCPLLATAYTITWAMLALVRSVADDLNAAKSR